MFQKTCCLLLVSRAFFIFQQSPRQWKLFSDQPACRCTRDPRLYRSRGTSERRKQVWTIEFKIVSSFYKRVYEIEFAFSYILSRGKKFFPPHLFILLCFAANILTRLPLVETMTNHRSANIAAVSTPHSEPCNRVDILFCPARMRAVKLYHKQMDVPWKL